MNPLLQLLADFTEGRLDISAFEEKLYQDAALEQLLSEQQAPRHAHWPTLYHYLINLDYRNPGDILNAQSTLSDFLLTLGIHAEISAGTTELMALLSTAQPKWLDVDLSYAASLLLNAPPDSNLREKKKWLKDALLSAFRYIRQPPRWLQAPTWPIGPSGPLVFLGQLPVDGYLHDKAAAYVFHDPAEGKCTTILQHC